MSNQGRSRTTANSKPLCALAALAAVLLLAGCAAVRVLPEAPREFDFDRDTFAFANEVTWKRDLPKLASASNEIPPMAIESDYKLHCFPVSRSSRQFFMHAKFAPSLPRASDDEYRELIDEVVSRDDRGDRSDPHPVVIPGYADLRAFSQDKEALLKDGIGTAMDSYTQRGNWRMIFPFTRRHQKNTAAQVLWMLHAKRPAVVHLVRFPKITINHAVLLYDAVETPKEIRFTTYDPNYSETPLVLTYDRATQTFSFPPTFYYAGGPVNVYEIYRRGLF
jgi:hypothetical protein